MTVRPKPLPGLSLPLFGKVAGNAALAPVGTHRIHVAKEQSRNDFPIERNGASRPVVRNRRARALPLLSKTEFISGLFLSIDGVKVKLET